MTSVTKVVATFLGIGIGAGAILIVLSGGGYSSGNRENKDPRSILIETVLVEFDAGSEPVWGELLGDGRVARTELDTEAFGSLALAARLGSLSEGVRLRSPSALVQHAEEGSISISTPSGKFKVVLSPRVLDDDVIRLAVRAEWAGSPDGEQLHYELSTVFTSNGAGGVVMDLGGTLNGGGVLLVIRPTLLDASEQ